MGIQEGQDLPAGHAGPQQPRRNQPFPLLLPHDSHNLELLHITVQLVLQVVWEWGEEELALSEWGDADPCSPAAHPAAPIPPLGLLLRLCTWVQFQGHTEPPSPHTQEGFGLKEREFCKGASHMPCDAPPRERLGEQQGKKGSSPVVEMSLGPSG